LLRKLPCICGQIRRGHQQAYMIYPQGVITLSFQRVHRIYRLWKAENMAKPCWPYSVRIILLDAATCSLISRTPHADNVSVGHPLKFNVQKRQLHLVITIGLEWEEPLPYWIKGKAWGDKLPTSFTEICPISASSNKVLFTDHLNRELNKLQLFWTAGDTTKRVLHRVTNASVQERQYQH